MWVSSKDITKLYFFVFLHSSVGKESTYNAGDLSLIPGLGRSIGEGIGYPFQYSWVFLVAQLVKNPPAMQETWVWSLGWDDPLEKEEATHSSILAWRIPRTIVHGVAKSWTWLSDFHFTSRYTQTVFHPITKLFSAILLRKHTNIFIPIFSQIFKSKLTFYIIYPDNSWRRKWQPTAVFLPRKCHGKRSRGGLHTWGCKESDMI